MPTLIIPPRAEEDLEAIWAFVAGSNPAAADRLIDQLAANFDRLATNPEAGRVRNELLVNLRCFPVRNYLIFYQRTVEGIEIFRVLHGSRDIPRIFDELVENAE